MSWQAGLMLAVVLLVGVPSAWRNVTAAALVISWSSAEVLWLVTGDNLPLMHYWFADFFVMLIVCAKAWANKATRWDVAIMLIFPMAWLYYLDQEIGAFHKWMALWFLVLAQFALAGADSFFQWLDPRKANALATADDSPDNPSSGVEYRWAWGRAGHV